MIDGAALAAAPAPRARRPRLLPWAPLVTLALLIGPVETLSSSRMARRLRCWRRVGRMRFMRGILVFL